MSSSTMPTRTILRLDEDIFKNPYVELIYKSQNEGQEIFVMLILKRDNFHYVAVPNLDRLLNFRDRVEDIRIQSHWCHKCLHGFQILPAFNKHLPLCIKNVEKTTMYTMPKEKYIAFNDWSKIVQVPFVIYADFESILPPDPINFQRHEPIAASFVLLRNGIPLQYIDFVGADCVVKFLKAVDMVARLMVYSWYDRNGNKPMTPLTEMETLCFENQTICYLCKSECDNLVHDHDHFTGKYLGGACNKCNLSRRVKPFLPIVFHNLKGYDMHHILKYALSKFPKWNCSVIPQTIEKFTALTVHINRRKYKFIDSLQFLNCSLANLVSNLPSLPLTSQVFDVQLMNGKGIFPYNFATSLDILKNTTSLPPIWPEVNIEQYNKALLVWEHLRCRNLLDYMNAYLKLDVYLLADVFETFRKKSLAEDGLEPLSFYTMPGLCLASALKQLKTRVELVQDPELYSFFDNGIRGGMTFINKHHVVSDEVTQLLYIDINNLYGWALSQKLPCGEFRWLDTQEEMDEALRKCHSDPAALDGDIGYTLEVDIEIPDYLHDFLDDLPVAPFSECPPNGSKVKKLLMTHSKKFNYVVHGKLLNFWMNLGVIVSRVHRVVEFKQALLFADYIKNNADKRAASTNDFDKEFYKFKNNSLYGKLIENLKKRRNLRLCNNSKTLITYSSSALFNRSIKIADDLVAALLLKEFICLDKPSYIGQSVLDLSKLRMYQLQYVDLQWYRDELNCEINVVAGDTDSFFLECKNVDLRTQLLPLLISDGLLDTSNYPVTDPLYSLDEAGVIGRFKDESKGFPFHEWYFLRPKCYSLLGGQIR